MLNYIKIDTIFTLLIVEFLKTFNCSFFFKITTCSERPLPFVMSQILGTDIKEDTVHSLLICKKCFKLFDEVDELEQRLNEVKVELVSNYKKSIQKNKNGNQEENNEKNEENDTASIKEKLVIQLNESNKENQVPQKILDIPSSDEEVNNTENCNNTEKDNYNSIEDIEIELEKIHGVEDAGKNSNEGEKEIGPLDTAEDTSQSYQDSREDIIDAGAVDNSSDSDYEPPSNSDNTDALLQAAAVAEKMLDKNSIKIEPSEEDDKPNILKRKAPSIIKSKVPSKKVKEEDILPPVRYLSFLFY